MNGFGFILIFVISFLPVIAILTTYSVPESPDDSKSPVIIETNTIGCNKYSFKGDRYWKCPKQLDIDYIEEHRIVGKTTSTHHVPVVDMED